jgi:hypothetical protein
MQQAFPAAVSGPRLIMRPSHRSPEGPCVHVHSTYYPWISMAGGFIKGAVQR